MIPTFAGVYRDQFGFVWASLLRLGVPTSSVEDALQDVFVVVHRRLDAFQARSAVRTWVFGIVRRIAFRYRRSAARADRKRNAAARELPTVLSMDDAVQRKQVGALVLRALDELDADKREAVVLHVFEDLTGPQVADMLGLPVDTAYSRIKAGRRVLRERLAAMGVHDDPRVVAAVRVQTQPRKGAQRRVAAALAIRIGAQATAQAAAVNVAAWKSVAVAVGLAVAAATGAQATRSDPPEPAPRNAAGIAVTPADLEDRENPTVRVDAIARAPATAPAVRDVEPRVAVPTARASADRAALTKAAPPSSPDALPQEVALVQSIRAALDRADPSSALEFAVEHARRFPTGQLKLERGAYRAIALCELGRLEQGRAEARLFVSRHPEATLAARVADRCALTPEKSAPR